MITCDWAADPGPVNILSGQVIDQAMLLGVLNNLHGLGLYLIGVECLVDGVHNGDAD